MKPNTVRRSIDLCDGAFFGEILPASQLYKVRRRSRIVVWKLRSTNEASYDDMSMNVAGQSYFERTSNAPSVFQKQRSDC